jgi:hypothetical protein
MGCIINEHPHFISNMSELYLGSTRFEAHTGQKQPEYFRGFTQAPPTL